MENPRNPGTLKVQNFEGKNLQDANRVPELIGLGENCTGLESVLVEENGIAGNVKHATCVVEVGNRANDILGTNDRVEDVCTSIDWIEADGLECQLNRSFRCEDVEVSGVEGDRMQENLSGSLSECSNGKVEIWGKSIPLLVNNRENLFNRDEICLSKLTVNKEISEEDENGKVMFFVGDIIWVKAKSQTWWPGKIYNPSDESKYAAKSHNQDCLLVGFFGSGHVTWCCPAQLKPFHENFEELSRQSKSRSFLAAVNKAVNEFCMCVKFEMSSSPLRGSQQSTGIDGVTEAGMSILELGPRRLGSFSFAQFEPGKFLENIKFLAIVVSPPCGLDLAVVQNRISAFYSSIGHNQLPMCHLWEKTDVSNSFKKKVESEDKIENMLLEHQRSYTGEVQIVPDNVASKLNDTEVNNVSDSLCKEEVNLLRYSITDDREVTSASNGDGKTIEDTDKGFESRERKKSRYLSYPYVDWGKKGLPSETEDSKTSKVSCGEMGNCDAEQAHPLVKCGGNKFMKKRRLNDGSDMLKLRTTTSAELLSSLHHRALDCLFPNENGNFELIELFFYQFRDSAYIHGQNDVIAMESCMTGEGVQKVVSDRNEQLDTTGSLVNSPLEKLHPRPKVSKMSERNKGKNSSRSKAKSLSGPPESNISIATDTVSVKDPLGLMPLLSNSKPKRKKRKKKEAALSVWPHTKQTTGLPDLNKNCAIPVLLAENSQVPSSLTENCQIPSVLTENSQILSDIAPIGKPNSKKRKRKEGATPKHSKTKLAFGVPDLNGTYRMETNSEGGTGLTLTFSLGVDMPSEEVLVSTFCRFGPLKESETRVQKDSGHAQVVFTRSADAREALRSIEKNNPFGCTGVCYQLHNLSATAKTVGRNKKLLMPSGSQPMGGLKNTIAKNSGSSGDALPLHLIKQNLEMMTSMLEKSGNDLSPEMRTKLEGEIRGLLQKVGTMSGSS